MIAHRSQTLVQKRCDPPDPPGMSHPMSHPTHPRCVLRKPKQGEAARHKTALETRSKQRDAKSRKGEGDGNEGKERLRGTAPKNGRKSGFSCFVRFLLLVVRPGAPNVASDRSVRSEARSPERSFFSLFMVKNCTPLGRPLSCFSRLQQT